MRVVVFFFFKGRVADETGYNERNERNVKRRQNEKHARGECSRAGGSEVQKIERQNSEMQQVTNGADALVRDGQKFSPSRTIIQLRF